MHVYRLSLKYEPNSSSSLAGAVGGTLRQSKSYEDLLGPFDQSLGEQVQPKAFTPEVAVRGLLAHRHSDHNIQDRRNTVTVATSNHLASSPSLPTHSKSPLKTSKSFKASAQVNVQLMFSGPSFDDNFESSHRPKKGGTLPTDIRMDPPNFYGHGKSSRAQSESEEKSKKSNPKSLVPWKIKHRKAQSLGGK